jgi:hypothetical protein
MRRISSRFPVPLALVCGAVVLLLPIYAGVLPRVWHLWFMTAALLLAGVAPYFHDKGRARTLAMTTVNQTGPKIRFPRWRRR